MIATAVSSVALVLSTPPLPATPIVTAVVACSQDQPDLGDHTYFVAGTVVAVLDEGHSVVIDGDTFDVADCVRGELGLPEWTRAAWTRTTSMAGLVRVDLLGYSMLWSYHPDNGALVVIYDEEAGGGRS